MVDIHCHILPGLDDGSDNIEESVIMAKLAAECGTKAIIVTPHSNIPNSFQNQYSKAYEDKLNKLNARLQAENVPVEIFPGHEIFAHADFLRQL